MRLKMAETDFYIGQIFEETYPPEAAVWCNSHGDRYITELEKEGAKRRFQIVAVPEPTTEEIAAQVRAKRDALLAETDFLMMPDYPLGEEDATALKTYRQGLRDVPTQEGFPTEITWPDFPATLSKKVA
nr:MAG TPA: tail assembly chaperone protein [Caudoviricetes sp.]